MYIKYMNITTRNNTKNRMLEIGRILLVWSTRYAPKKQTVTSKTVIENEASDEYIQDVSQNKVKTVSLRFTTV